MANIKSYDCSLVGCLLTILFAAPTFRRNQLQDLEGKWPCVFLSLLKARSFAGSMRRHTEVGEAPCFQSLFQQMDLLQLCLGG